MIFGRKKDNKDKKGPLDFTSLSDLFMMLSVTFLILFVIGIFKTNQIDVIVDSKSKNEIEHLKAQINILKNEEILRTISSKTPTRDYVSEKLKKLKELEQRATEIRKRQEALAKIAIDRELNLKKYRDLFESAIVSNHSYKDDLARIQTDVLIEQDQKEKVEHDLKETKKDLDETKKAFLKTEQELRKTDEQYFKLERNFASTDKTLKKTKIRLEESKTLLNKTNKVMAGLKSQNNKLKVELSKSEKKLVLLNSKFKVLAETKKDIESKLKESISWIEKNKSEIEKLRLDSAELKELREHYNKLNKEFIILSTSNISFDEELLKTKDKLSKIDDENKKLEDYKKRFEILLKQNKRIENAYEKLKGKYVKALDSNTKLEGKNDKIEEIEAKFRKLLAEKKIFEAKYNKALEEKLVINSRLSSLKEENSKIDELKNEMRRISKQRDQLAREVEELGLESAIRYSLSENIRRNFKANGIDAKVDPRTGDVHLTFSKFYFMYGSDKPSKQMQKTLERVFPIYAKSIYENGISSKYIKNIEIIGTSSPTYNKKLIEPHKTNSTFAKKAMEYNLDLSYRRAKSIFKHVFHNKRFDFKYKKKMLSNIKLTGIGYLKATKLKKRKDRNVASAKSGACAVYDCTPFQVVIIRLNLDGKK